MNHIHGAFLALKAESDMENFPDVETAINKFIKAFKKFLRDWSTEKQKTMPDATTFGHDLDLAIDEQTVHLTENGIARLPFALERIIRMIKQAAAQLDGSTYVMCEEKIQLYLDDILSSNFCHIYKTISQILVRKIQQFKKVAVFDWCPVVNHVLLDARNQIPGMQLTVIEANSNGRGRMHMNSFVDHGYNLKHVPMKGASWALSDSNILILGCSAIFSNGSVGTQKGAIAVALCAKHNKVPVIVIAEHFKIVEENKIHGRLALTGRQNIEMIPLNLIDAVVSDLGCLVPQHAPVLFKKKVDSNMN